MRRNIYFCTAKNYYRLNMYTISISQEIKEACPVFAGAAVYAKAGDASEFLNQWLGKYGSIEEIQQLVKECL